MAIQLDSQRRLIYHVYYEPGTGAFTRRGKWFIEAIFSKTTHKWKVKLTVCGHAPEYAGHLVNLGQFNTRAEARAACVGTMRALHAGLSLSPME